LLIGCANYSPESGFDPLKYTLIDIVNIKKFLDKTIFKDADKTEIIDKTGEEISKKLSEFFAENNLETGKYK